MTGIDTSSYGKEFTNYRFSNLLNDILLRFPSLYRLRISSIEISEIDDLFLDLLKKYPNIANHLHIPLQSGTDKVLKDMNRKYTTKDFEEKLRKIYRIRPDIAITSDVIVAYPTESEEDFNKTCEFIKKMKFMELHVFPFSPRKNTLASHFKDLSSTIKKERVKKLIAISNELKQEYSKRFLNQELEVLFEKNNEGLTTNYLRIRENGKPNEIKKILINSNNLLV